MKMVTFYCSKCRWWWEVPGPLLKDAPSKRDKRLRPKYRRDPSLCKYCEEPGQERGREELPGDKPALDLEILNEIEFERYREELLQRYREQHPDAPDLRPSCK